MPCSFLTSDAGFSMKFCGRSFLRFLCVLVLSTSATALVGSAASLGAFDADQDVGEVQIPGKASYDPDRQVYTVESSGTNMWGDHDEFHFVWKKVTGDFIVQALTEFAGPGADEHRKMGIVVRASLDPRSPQVNACRHGGGPASLQFRRTEGAATEELQFQVKTPDVLQLSRQGDKYTMSVARAGETYTSQSMAEVVLGDAVYVGIYVCAHKKDVSEKGIFRNVRLIRPARETFVPYRDYIGSEVELLDVASGNRKTIFHADDSIQAPNWAPNNQRLFMNHNGRMFTLDLKTYKASPLDTGEQVRCNNDHALSWDGNQLGISSGEVSTVYILPSRGGEPKKITTENPSYLHGWSPDGKFLVYTGIRDGAADLYRISVEGGSEQRLTEAKGLDDGSEYTPDGQYIYFNSERTGRMQIWRMKADGTGQEQVTHDDFNNWFPHVSPDGKSIVFISYGADIPPGDHPFYKHVYIRKLSLSGGEPRVVAYLYGGQGSMNVNSWSPDSAFISFVSNSDKF